MNAPGQPPQQGPQVTSESQGLYDPNKYLDTQDIDEVECRAFMQKLPCPVPDCTGNLQKTGLMKPSDPPQNEHKCTACEYRGFVTGETFPRIDFRPIAVTPREMPQGAADGDQAQDQEPEVQ